MRWRSSLSNRAFSMAMTAWAAKFCDKRDLLVGEGADFLAVQVNTPISSFSFSIGTARSVRTPPSSTAATADGLRCSM